MMMDSRKLPSGMAEALGYYVYLYLDPDTHEIFYVGKGQGNRCFAHLNDERECEKAHIIRDLRARNKEPRIEILIHGLSDEETAFRVECAVIDLLDIQKLTNQQRGWRSGVYGRMPLSELIIYFEQPPVVIDDPVILIRINQMYHYGITELELYEATRGRWVVGERRNQAKYALAIFDGLVREVYRIDKWHPGNTTVYLTRHFTEEASGRWEFTGEVAESAIRDKYLLKSVREYLAPNSQNPIKYVNC
jgi:hypothetical protein